MGYHPKWDTTDLVLSTNQAQPIRLHQPQCTTYINKQNFIWGTYSMISRNFQIHFLWKHLIRDHRVRDIHIVTFWRTWSSIDRQSSDPWTKTERSETSWIFDRSAQSKFYQNLLELCQFWGRNGPNFHFCRRYKYDCIQIQKTKFEIQGCSR